MMKKTGLPPIEKHVGGLYHRCTTMGRGEKTMIKRNPIRIGIAVIFATATFAFADRDKEPSSPAQPVVSEKAPAPSQAEADRPVLQKRKPRYQVRKGDILDLNFPFSPEFNQTVAIQPDGYITLRGLGDIPVEGLTKPELTEKLEKAYSKILRKPVISVELKDFEKPYFVAGGEVGKPGKYELRGDTTVTQAVALAGGFSAQAKHSQVLLFRRVSDDWVSVKKLNLKKMLAEANLTEDVHLEPGDMLFVPKNALSKIAPFIPKPAMYLNQLF